MMKTIRICTLFWSLTIAAPAFADLYFFTYTFDGITPFGQRGEPGTTLTGVIDGSLQSDGDTIIVNDLFAATLSGFDYEISPQLGLRGHIPGSLATLSHSGNILDIWVCVQGFSSNTANGGDCDFGEEGGFLINNNAGDLALVNFPGLSGREGLEQTIAWSGIPELNEIHQTRFRVGDIPVNSANWEISLVDGDNDGVSDDADICAASDLAPTVSIFGVDSGVANNFFAETGCSTADLVERAISDCANSRNHGQFMKCAARGTNALKDSGVITGKEKGALQKTLAKSK